VCVRERSTRGDLPPASKKDCECLCVCVCLGVSECVCVIHAWGPACCKKKDRERVCVFVSE